VAIRRPARPVTDGEGFARPAVDSTQGVARAKLLPRGLRHLRLAQIHRCGAQITGEEFDSSCVELKSAAEDLDSTARRSNPWASMDLQA